MSHESDNRTHHHPRIKWWVSLTCKQRRFTFLAIDSAVIESACEILIITSIEVVAKGDDEGGPGLGDMQELEGIESCRQGEVKAAFLAGPFHCCGIAPSSGYVGWGRVALWR